MDNPLIFPAGSTSASHYAADFLLRSGFKLVDHPTPEITHLLLDVPSFDGAGRLRSGADVKKLLEMLPQRIVVIGGNLEHPALHGYRTVDLLQDANYVAENAAITADCAIQVAAPLLKTTWVQSPVLIIGWGRIGKCLARILHALGVEVTVAARKETDRAILRALGYQAVDCAKPMELKKYRVIFNTAPEPVLDQVQLAVCRNCVKIDLASRRGIEGDDVVWARGLPGIYAPETSGALIAKTVMNILKEDV